MNRQRAFTLIELTIVLALVALLLTIAVPRYFHTVDNGRFSVQQQNLAAIRDALDKFYGDQGKYPDALDDLVTKRYLRAVPVDPLTQLPNWTVIPPEDATQGRVYDVRSAKETTPRENAPKADAPADGRPSAPQPVDLSASQPRPVRGDNAP